MKELSWTLSVVFLFAGCMIHGSEETTIERFHFETTGRPKVEVRLDNGSIQVLGNASRDISVTVVKKARGPSSEAAAAMLEQLQVEANQRDRTVRVEVRKGAGWEWQHNGISFRTGHLRADVEIHLPREAELELLTDDGRIDIERLEGRIVAETEDGRVRLREIQGEVQIRSSDGSIDGSELVGDFVLATGDGGIEVDGRFHRLRAETSDGSIRVRCEDDTPSPAEDWLIRTLDGSVSLTLPRSLSAELEASTSDGRIENELALSDGEETEQWVKGRLGDGGKLILVRTSDGSIHLRTR